MNKLFLSLIVVCSVLLGVFVFAQTIVGNFIVNANSCYESDSGLDYGNYGIVNGSFWWPIGNSSNGTFVGAFSDVCLNNITLLEGVCGSSISSSYSGVAGAVYVDCNVPNSAFGCVNGACRLVGGNGTGNLTLYDDFSLEPLNTNKWMELQFHNNPFTDEHFVNSSENGGVYHVAQLSVGDAETNLRPTINFTAGQSFSYEVTYSGGSGNHFSQPLINGNYPPTQTNPCLASGGCGPIGYWNGVPDLGAQIGTYHIKFDFFQNQVMMTAVRPDNVTVINTFTGNSAPYTLDINTHTGHNGLMHFDYDNFYFSGNINSTTNNTNQTLPLVALWHFDESSGTTTADSSSNGNTGTLQNGVSWVQTGVSGSALHFDGGSGVVTTIHTPSIDVTQQVEIEAWVKPGLWNDSGTILSKNGPYFIGRYGNNKLHGGVYTDNNAGTYTWTEIDGTTNLQIGTWYKVKMIYDGANIKLYVNDTLESSISKVGRMPQVSQNLNIGYGSSGHAYHFNGEIDEVSVRGY